MSKTYFDGSACVNGIRRMDYETLEVHGGNRAGLLGDRESWSWQPHDYYSMTKADLISILGGRGSVGWTARTKADMIDKLEQLDEYVRNVGIKGAIQNARYKKMNLPKLYTEARRRGYPETDKCRSELEKWLCKKDITDLRRQKDRVILKSAKELHDGKIDLAEFNSRCSEA